MRILYALTNISFPAREGAHEQTLRVIKGISERGNACCILAFVTDGDSFDEAAFRSYAPDVEIAGIFHNSGTYTGILLRNMLAASPQLAFPGCKNVMFSFMLTPADRILRESLGSLASRFDVIHGEGIPLAPIVQSEVTKPVIFSTVDAWSLRQRRLLSMTTSVKGKVMRTFSYFVALSGERFFLKRFRYVHVVSPNDADYLLRRRGLPAVVSVPVSLPDELNTVPASRSRELRKTILFCGDIRVPHVLEGICAFLNLATPILLREFPSINIRLLTRAAAFGNLEGIVARWPSVISVETWVDDFVGALASADVIVLPDASGTGQKNRTVVALATGRPVVGSGWAFEGIRARTWRECIIARSQSEMVEGVLACLRRSSLGDVVGRNGAKFAQRHFRLESVLNSWERLYASTAA
jgi:glycosyltransferase involved in cell wall biosynthesis